MTFRNMLILYAVKLLYPAQFPWWNTTPFRPSATAYSAHSFSQL